MNSRPWKHSDFVCRDSRPQFDHLRQIITCHLHIVQFLGSLFNAGIQANPLALYLCQFLIIDLCFVFQCLFFLLQLFLFLHQRIIRLDFRRAQIGAGICLSSTFFNKKTGQLESRIRPTLENGSIITDTRANLHYLCTEYGCVNLKGLTTWEKAEALINVAHPDFREELIKEAEKMHIWRRSNKI